MNDNGSVASMASVNFDRLEQENMEEDLLSKFDSFSKNKLLPLNQVINLSL